MTARGIAVTLLLAAAGPAGCCFKCVTYGGALCPETPKTRRAEPFDHQVPFTIDVGPRALQVGP